MGKDPIDLVRWGLYIGRQIGMPRKPPALRTPKKPPAPPTFRLSPELDDLDQFGGPSLLVRRPSDLDPVDDHCLHAIEVESLTVPRYVLEQILRKLKRYDQAELRFTDPEREEQRRKQRAKNAREREQKRQRKAAAAAGK